MPAIDLGRLRVVARDARRVDITRNAGQVRASVFAADGQRQVFDVAAWRPAVQRPALIARAAGPLVPQGHVVAIERLLAQDAYWYDVTGMPRLPVLRLRFDDPVRTWLHVDPETGAVLNRMDRSCRLYRWLFDLLHKWDVNALTIRRPLWDLLLWGLSAFGLVTSVSGIWLGWKRLRRKTG